MIKTCWLLAILLTALSSDSLDILSNILCADQGIVPERSTGTGMPEGVLGARGASASEETSAGAVGVSSDSIDRYWQILVKTPKYGSVFDQVWRDYVAKGEVEQLTARCRRLVAQSPRAASCRLLEGLVLARQGLEAEALESWRRASELAPDDVRGFLYRGELLFGKGELSQAAIELEQAYRRSSDPEERGRILLLLGRIDERSNDSKKAAQTWRRFEECFPDDPEVKLRIAETLVDEGKYSGALGYYEELIQLCRDDDELRLRYSFEASGLMIRSGRRKEGESVLRTIADSISEEHWLAGPVRDQLERLYLSGGDFSGLARYYESRLAICPGEVETIRRLALVYIQAGQVDKARGILTQSLEQMKSAISLRLLLVELLADIGDLAATERECNELLRVKSDDVDLVARLGLAILRCGGASESSVREKAIRCWESLLEGHERDTGRIIQLAGLLSRNGLGDEAEPYYRRAVELEPGAVGLRVTLARHYFSRGLRDNALRELETASRGQECTPENVRHIGDVLLSFGCWHEGVDTLHRAVSLADSRQSALGDDVSLLLHTAGKTLDWFESDKRFVLYLDAKHRKKPMESTRDEPCVRTAVQRLNDLMTRLETAIRTETDFAEYVSLDCRRLRLSGILDIRTKELAARGAKPLTSWERYRLAVYEVNLGHEDQAIGIVQEALSAYPDSVLLLRLASTLFCRGGDEKRLPSVLERLARLDSGQRLTLLKRKTDLELKFGQMESALKTAATILALSPESVDNRKRYANILLQLGKTEEGIESLRGAARACHSPAALTSIAESLSEYVPLEEVIRLYDRARMNSDDAGECMDITDRMITLLGKGGKLDRFAAQLEQETFDLRRGVIAACCLARVRLAMGDVSSARKTLETAGFGKNFQKAETVVMEQLAQLAALQGDVSGAIRYRERLYELAPSETTRRRLLSLYETGNKGEIFNRRIWSNLVRSMTLGEQLTLYERQMFLRQYELAHRVLVNIRGEGKEQWGILYRQGELAACTGKREDSQKCFQRLRQLNLRDDEPAFQSAVSLRSAKLSVIEQARKVLSLSVKSGKRSIAVSECFRGVMLPESLVLFATVLGDAISGNHLRDKTIVWYRPENYGDAVLASRFWEMIASWQVSANSVEDRTKAARDDTGLSGNMANSGKSRESILLEFALNLRRDYPNDWHESDCAGLYDRLRRRCVLESVICALFRMNGHDGTKKRKDIPAAKGAGARVNMKPENELVGTNDQIEVARRMMLSLGFLSAPDDVSMADWRDECYRLLVRSISDHEIDKFWKTFDLNAAMAKYYASPVPELDAKELRPKRIIAVTGMPESLEEKLQWIVAWLEQCLETPEEGRLQTIYQKVSNEIYEQSGQVMDLLAPVYSCPLRVSDYYMIREAIDKSGNRPLGIRFEKIMKAIAAREPEFDLNGAFAAITRHGILLNASDSSLLRFNPRIAFPKNFKGLTDSLFWLDRFVECRARGGNVTTRDVVSLDLFFFVCLLHAGDMLFEWTQLPRDLNSCAKLVRNDAVSGKPWSMKSDTTIQATERASKKILSVNARANTQMKTRAKTRMVEKSELLELYRSLDEVDKLVDLYLLYRMRLYVLERKTETGNQSQAGRKNDNVLNLSSERKFAGVRELDDDALRRLYREKNDHEKIDIAGGRFLSVLDLLLTRLDLVLKESIAGNGVLKESLKCNAQDRFRNRVNAWGQKGTRSEWQTSPVGISNTPSKLRALPGNQTTPGNQTKPDNQTTPGKSSRRDKEKLSFGRGFVSEHNVTVSSGLLNWCWSSRAFGHSFVRV